MARQKNPKHEGENFVLPVPSDTNGKAQGQKKNLPAQRADTAVGEATVPIHFHQEEKRRLFSQLGLLLAIIVVLAASVLIFVFRPTSYDERTNSVNFIYHPDSNTTLVAVNGTERGEISGQLRYKTYDRSGKVCAALVDDRLFLVKGKKVSEIATTVTDCVLSASGDALAWRSAENKLYYAIVGDKDGVSCISQKTEDPRYALSPDGKEMFYTYVDSDGVTRCDVYSRTGSKPYFSNDTALYPIAVSNDCRYLYYTDANGALFVWTPREETKVECAKLPDLAGLAFNRDLSQLMLRDGSKTLLFVKGQGVRLPDMSSDDTLELIPNQRVAVRPLITGYQYLTDSLLDSYYVRRTGTTVELVYLTQKKDQGTLAKIAFVDDAAGVTVTDKRVFFLSTSDSGDTRHTNLYVCKTGKTVAEILHWDVSHYLPNVDGSRLVYVDKHGALYGHRLGADPIRLSDTVVAESLCLTADDMFYFCVREGELWVSDNAEGARSVSSGVDRVMADSFTVFYATEMDETGLGKVYSNYRGQRKSELLTERAAWVQ
ncbi:MAG: hypothetical protein IJY50_05175 [Clostridia bacterium]|nr:hypothetical protein [Clostridia bacterium]